MNTVTAANPYEPVTMKPTKSFADRCIQVIDGQSKGVIVLVVRSSNRITATLTATVTVPL